MQKDWLEWLASAEFVINNKAYLTTKLSPFIVNYGRELRMGINIRRKGKMEKATEFAERSRSSIEESTKSMKDLVFKKRLAKKLVDQYVGSYTINEVVSTNAVKR